MIGLTAPQMQYEAKVAYEAIASADAPGYTSKQWSMLLTQAQENIVLENLRIGFDFDELRRRVIESLISHKEYNSDNIESEAIIGEHAYRIELEENYMHVVKDTANSTVKVRPVSYDFYHANINNPFESPYEKEYWRLVGNNAVIIITDGSDLEEYSIVYLRRPTPIITKEGVEVENETGIQDCELDHTVHRQIVNEAAKLAHAYTNNQAGYQIQSMESNRSRFGPQQE